MNGLLNAAVASATAVTLLVLPGVAVTPGHAEERGDDWREIFQRAVEASRQRDFHGEMVVVSLDDAGGPNVVELEVTQDAGAALQVGKSESWMVGRSDAGGFYWEPDAGTLLTFGSVEPRRTHFSINTLLKKYAVEVDGQRQLASGPARVLVIRERGTDHPRERLFVDVETDLVVRRETFTRAGQPTRLVAFTSLDAGHVEVSTPEPTDESSPPTTELSPRGRERLTKIGWFVPEQLPGEFHLRDSFATGEAEGSLQLVYSDGLYTLSVYQQVGTVDPDALDGAVARTHDDLHIWRWPGAEPERVVWTGADRTFTAVSDAPLDTMLTALDPLPSDSPPDGIRRIARGLARVAGWLWPFD